MNGRHKLEMQETLGGTKNPIALAKERANMYAALAERGTEITVSGVKGKQKVTAELARAQLQKSIAEETPENQAAVMAAVGPILERIAARPVVLNATITTDGRQIATAVATSQQETTARKHGPASTPQRRAARS